MNLSRSHLPAFTLIELVLVLAMLAMLMALAAPSLRGWGQGAKLRNGSDQLLTATRWARAQAISTAVVHRLETDPNGTTFRVVAQDPALTAANEYAHPIQLPSNLRVEIMRPDGVAGVVDFHPNGRLTPAVIRITSEAGDVVMIQARTPADSFRSVTAEGGAQ